MIELVRLNTVPMELRPGCGLVGPLSNLTCEGAIRVVSLVGLQAVPDWPSILLNRWCRADE